MKRKDIREAEIKKWNPTYLSKVKSGDLTLTEAYNIMMSDIMGVKEMKGKGSKSNKISLEEEFEIINKRYKPKIDEWIELLKKQYPFTYKDYIKED